MRDTRAGDRELTSPPGTRRYTQDGVAVYVICAIVAAGLAVAGAVAHVTPLFVMPFVLLLIALAFSQVTLDVEPAGIAISMRGRFFKTSVPYADIRNLRVIRYSAPSLGYRVGFGLRIWAVSWGSALTFDRADGTRCIVGCDQAAAALADIAARGASLG